MKYSNTVEYNISTKLDSSGLTKLQSQIKQLENSMQQMANRELLNSDKVQAAKTQLEGLNTALTNSFNSSLGILDLSKFRAELDAGGVSAKGLQSAFNMMGAEGQAALNGLTTQIANFNGGMERTSSQIDKIFTTFSNTFRWGLVSSFFSQFMNAIHSSVDYVKELDDSLTQIMLVTDYNRDSMNEFARSANEAAKAVSMTTTGMTNASLIFAQQGYGLGQSQELATLSAKLANASQQDTATTSDQITAYMNAYGLENSIGELTQAMDNWALIANISAADVGELAQASQRAASMANTVGVSGEQLAAQIATIESVTREAPEQIGNGLKTLYARFSDISAGGEDEDGVSLGDVTKQLNNIGVQVLDQFGNIRDVGDIMEDLMVVWDDLDETSKIAAAQSLAGKYQVNRFVSLMDNSDMYREYLGATGSSAAGTLDQMNEEYAQSIEGRSAKLQASLEGLFSTIFNTDDIYPWMDAAQGAIDLLQQFFDALGGGKTVLLGITSLLTQAFSQNIARSINDTIANRNLGQIRKQNIDTVGDTLTRAGIDNTQGVGKYIKDTADQAKLGALSDAQYDTYMNNVQQWANAQTALTQAEEDLTDTINVVNMAYGKTTGNKNAIFNDEGVLNTQLANEERANLSDRQLNRLMQDTDFSDVAEKAKEFSQSLQNVENQMKKVNADSENYDQQMTNLAQAIDLAGDKLAEFNALNIASDDMVESILGDLTSLETKIRTGGEASEEAEKEIAELISMIGRLGKSAKDMNPQAFKQAMLGAGDLVDKKKGNVDFAQTQTNRAEENALDAQKNIDSQQQVKSILDTLNAVQQLTFAWQAFQSLGSLWANEDLSTGEKVLQIIMNLTMAMPQLITAMQTLQENPFLQNIGNGLMGALNGTLPSVGDFETLAKGKESASQLEFLRGIVETGDQAKAALGEVTEAGGKFAPQLLEMAKNGDEARKVLGEIGPTLEKNAKAGEVAETALGSMSGVMGKAMAAAAAEGATGLGVLGAGLKAVAVEAWAAMTPLLPFIAIGAAIAGVAYLIGQEAEKAKQAHEEALAALEDTKNAQQQVEDLSSQINDWQSKRNEQGNTKELAQDADALADSLRELGNEEEAAAIHLAAIRAEALGTSESFEELDKVMEKAQFDIQNNADLATMEAANAILKDRLSTTEELAAAQEDLQNAALDYNLRQASKTNGWEMGVLNTPGDDDIRAATMDWQSLNSILEQSVPGFAEITDENERLSLALAHTSDEAQRAAIQIQQMLNASNILSSDQKTGITRQLESAGFSANEALQIIASLNIDEETSYNDIVSEIQDIIRRVNEDKESLSVVLQAKMDPEQVKETVKSQIATYEPKDEDVDKENFDSLADTFYENKDQMGVEGTPFEDFSEDLFENATALEDVIEGILRYNDAIESLDKNYDNWKDTLENTNELSTEHLQVVEELQETYSDFLGLSKNVSKRFASNAENLELMQEAAEGNTEAFEDLEDAAAADIYMQVTGLEDLDAAQQKIEEINDILANSGIEEIPVGEIFNLDDFESVRSAIDSELQALGLNAEQAAQYVSDVWHLDIPADQFTVIDDDMNAAAASAESTATHVAGVVEGVTDTVLDNANYSVSTDIDSDTAEATDTVTFTNLTPQPIGPVPITSMMPVGNGNSGIDGGVHMEPFTAQTYGVGYTPETHTTEQLKQRTGFKEDVKAEKGGNGGHVGLPSGSGARGSRRPSGGSGRSGVSRPSSGGGGGGGGKGKSCFVAGTLISTSLGGFKPIEQIQKGDLVLSYNESSHQNEYGTVLQTMIHDTIEPIYTLYIKDEQLRVTGIHRFLVIDKITCGTPQWVHAADLHVGQWVLFADSTWHVIHKIEVNIEHQTVYNFEVSGNHNYYVGRNQILAHNKGGKGSGGGGGKAKTIENKEKKEHEKDYYEEVNSQLDKTEKILSGIEKEEDRLIGDKARANQNKQLKLLQKEIDLQTKKLKILTEQEKKDVAAALQKSDKEAEKILQKYAMITLPNPEFDEDGMIANYEQMSAAIDAAHNRLIEEYNKAAAAGNEERTKEIQKEIDKFDKLGESILKNAKRSNEIQTEIEEVNNTIEELNDSIEDIRIDAYKASQEALDNLKDIKESAAELNKLFRDFDDNSFGMNRWSIDDTPYGDLIENLSKLDEMYGITAESAGNFYDELIAQKKAALAATTDADEQDAISRAIQFFEEQKARLSDTDSLSNGLLGLSQQDLARLQEWMDNPDAADNPFGENTSALFDAYQDAYERTLSLFKDYRETIQDTRDTILDIYDETEESIERQMDQYDRLIEKVERISDTYTLYYGEDSYDQLDQFYARQGDIMQNQLDKLTDAYNYWQDQYEKAVAIGDEKLIQEVQDRMDDAEDAMLDAAQELAELWVEKFENAVEASSQHIYRDLFGTNDIEELTDNWELQKDYMERYRDDVEKAYEVDKLRSKYLDLLDEAQGSSAQTQNRIRQQMQEQLDLLQNQTTVSEYDVKLANAKLEILQKQMALEDAQRNKNKMQLRRDTQGNYRYIYTADQGDVRQAQQDLEDSEYDAYEMTKQETVANNDRAINMLQDYIQKRAAIWNKYKDDSTARAEALANLESEYSKIFDALQEDFADTSEGMIDVLNWLVQNGTENTTSAAIDMIHTLYDENGKIKDKTGQDWMDMASLIQDQVLPEIEDSVTKANLEMEKHADDLKESMTGTNGALTKIGSGASDVEDSMTKAADATRKLATATEELFTALGADSGELQKALDKLADYEKQLHSTQQTTSQLSTQLGQANKTIAAKNAEAQNYRTILDLKTGARDFRKGEEYTIKKGTWVWYDRDGAFQTDTEGAKGFAVPEDVKVKIMTDYLTMGDRQAYYPVTIYPTDQTKWGKHLADFEGEQGKRTRRQQDWHIGIETFRNALKYDTGGYTGDWKDQTQDAKNGKLALLHQKELVLNSTDTENILAAVNVVREITNAIKASTGYISALRTNAYSNTNTEAIQQRVEISATFPNVSSITDIEQALLNISDQAYIYANKTI